MTDSREDHLLELLWMKRSTATLASELSIYPWDRAHDLVRLTAEHVAHALEQYANGHIDASSLGAWAVAVSDREDIDQDPDTEPGSIINDLKRPERMLALTPQGAGRLAARLRREAR